MTDELDPDRLLASAALDNEVTPDERARVDASDILRSEMDAYRDIGAELRSMEVPAASRESAIAAALAVFDELAAGTSTSIPAATAASAPAITAGSNVVSLGARRQRQYGWLTGVAAAAVVAVLGIAVLSNGSGDDKKSSATVEQPASSAAKSSADANAPLAADTAASPAGSTAAAETGLAPDMASTNEASGGGGVGATTTYAGDTTLGDPWAGAPSLSTEDELRGYSASIAATASPVPSTAAGATDTTAASPDTAVAESTADTDAATVPAIESAPAYAVCPAPSNGTITPVLYRGQRVYLVRDDAARELRVLDASNCALVVTIPLD